MNAKRLHLWARHTTALAALGVAPILAPTPAHAASHTNPAAEEIAKKGRQLVAAGQYAKACPKLAEAQRIDPSTDALFELGQCHQKEGKIASAFVELSRVVEQAHAAGDQPTEKKAAAIVAQLSPKISHLTIKVPAGSEKNGLNVTIDGTSVPTSTWGRPTPIDPGTHEVEATIPNKQSWAMSVEVSKKKPGEQTVEVPAVSADAGLTHEQIKQRDAKLEDPEYAGKVSQPDKEKSDSAPPVKHPTLSYVLVGAGVASVAIGSYFGATAVSKRRESDQHCGPHGCTQTGGDLNQTAKTDAWIANIGIGLGAVAIGVGGYLFFHGATTESAGGEEKISLRVAPELTPTSAGLGMGGTW